MTSFGGFGASSTTPSSFGGGFGGGGGSTFNTPTLTLPSSFGGSAAPSLSINTNTTTTGTNFFGGSTSNPPPNPFGGGTTAPSNPFGGGSTTNPPPNPFGGGTSAPSLSLNTGTSTSSPFTTFGSSTTSNAPPSNPFGSSTTTPSLFGTTPSLFGSTTPAPSNPFGSTAPAPTTSPFGSTSGLAPTMSTSLFSQPQPQQPAQPTQHTPLQKLEALHKCFDPKFPECRFRHIFYNQVNAPPEDVKRMNAMKPANIDQLLWDQACRSNPDPTKFVPVQACGFDDLKHRITEQNKITAQQAQTLQDATKVIQYIKHNHTTNTMAKLDDYKRRQLEISQKLIRVICKLMVLEARGTRLTVGEEQLKRKFELILTDLNSPVLYRAKIEDFIALSRITIPSTPLPQLDERSLDGIAKALKEQRNGLEVLTTMVQKDTKDVQLMMSEFTTGQ